MVALTEGNTGYSPSLPPSLPRFCFFHSFFETKKPMSQIPETEQHFSHPLDSRTREVVGSAFFRWALGSLGEV